MKTRSHSRPFALWTDEKVIDGTVNLVGRVNRQGGLLAAWFDSLRATSPLM